MGQRDRCGIFGRVRDWGWIGNLDGIRDLDRYLDVLLAHILHSCVTLLLVKSLLNQFVIRVTLLLFRWRALLLGHVGVRHVATLVHQGLAAVDDLRPVPRHCHRVALDLHGLLTLLNILGVTSSAPLHQVGRPGHDGLLGPQQVCCPANTCRAGLAGWDGGPEVRLTLEVLTDATVVVPHDDRPHRLPELGELLSAVLRVRVLGTDLLQQDLRLVHQVVLVGEPVPQCCPALTALLAGPVRLGPG